jgi:hypothetical protein
MRNAIFGMQRTPRIMPSQAPRKSDEKGIESAGGTAVEAIAKERAAS